VKTLKKTTCLFTAIGFLLIAVAAAASPQLFVEDSQYLQKRAVKYSSRDGLPAGAVNALAICSVTVFAGAADGVYALAGDKWSAVAPMDEVSQLGCIENRLYAASGSGFYMLVPGAPEQAKKLYGEPVAAFTSYRDGFLLACGGEGEGVKFISPDASAAQVVPAFDKLRIRSIATDAEGVVWAASGKGLSSFKDGALADRNAESGLAGPPSISVRSIFPAAGGKVYFATSRGILIHENGRWRFLRGKPDGLPVEDVNSVAASGDTLIAGFSIGAARRKAGEWEYMQSGRWLPDDSVRAVAIAPDGSLWFGTGAGVGKIEYAPMTLDQKAAFFQNFVPLFMRYGFTGDATITAPGDFSSLKKRAHDNENVWTGMQIASQCFRYAVTREPDALALARESLAGLLFLETVTGTPGLFGRSYVAAGEDTGKGGEWHPTADGKWKWKADASSDEAVGRFFGLSVFYDHCANDDEKRLIAGSLSRTMNRIIDDDYFIIDPDGQPTMWARWNPKYLSVKGRFQRDLNSLEILMMLKVASHVTGEPRFQDEYMKLIGKYGYARNAVTAKLKAARMQNHSDDLLAFLSYYPLLQYEKDSALLDKYYYKSIRRTWRIVSEKRNPLWNYIYGASVPGDDFDADGAAWFLRRSPLDLIYWDVRNSQRADIEIDPNDGGAGEKLSVKPLPPDETFMLKFNENPYRLDGYWNGNNSETPSYWLLPYWLGRYHGFIR